MSSIDQLLNAIGDPMIRELASRGQTRTFPKNAVIINEGDRGDTLFVILSGKVKVYVSDDDVR
jgi:CRP/FNR family transcriptional regulator, cyclic AMP receptor protein